MSVATDISKYMGNAVKLSDIWGSILTNVKSYGARGNGITDDTSAIQKALDSNIGATCFFPPGTYVTSLLTVPSNITIVLSKNVHLKAKPLADHIFNITDRNNVTIIGDNSLLTMVKAGYTSEYNHAIRIYNSNNLYIKGLNISGTGGDGIAVGGPATSPPCDNVIIQDCTIDNARRNGISVVHAINSKILNCIFKNSNGTAPQFGIDVEPNPDSTLRNISIESCAAYGNAASGFGVGGGAKDITIRRCVSYSNGDHGIFVAQVGALMPENVTISDCISYSNTGGGTVVTQGRKISVENCRSYLNTSNGFNLQGSFESRIIESYTYENGGYGIVSNLSTDARIENNEVFRNFNAGIFISTSSIRPVITGNCCIDNANNSGATIKANIQVTNCTEPVVTCNIVRFTVASAVSVTGIYVTSNVINGYIKENDCFNGGTGSGIVVETAGGSINYGNRNKSGVYSTSENQNAGTLVWDPGSLVDGAGETSSAITVTGASFGKYVIVAAPYDLQGITCSAYVSAINTVRIRLQNETGGTIDLASGTWRVKLIEF